MLRCWPQEGRGWEKLGERDSAEKNVSAVTFGAKNLSLSSWHLKDWWLFTSVSLWPLCSDLKFQIMKKNYNNPDCFWRQPRLAPVDTQDQFASQMQLDLWIFMNSRLVSFTYGLNSTCIPLVISSLKMHFSANSHSFSSPPTLPAVCHDSAAVCALVWAE